MRTSTFLYYLDSDDLERGIPLEAAIDSDEEEMIDWSDVYLSIKSWPAPESLLFRFRETEHRTYAACRGFT